MTASTNDYWKKSGASTVTTLSAPGKAIGATSINVGSTTNYPSDTGIIIAIRVVDTNGELVAGTYTEFSATVSSGTSLAIVATPVYGSDQIYPAGSTTQVFIPVSSYAHNKLIDGISAFANQDATLKTTAVQAALNIPTTPTADWAALANTPNTVTYNGQRSYSLVFNGVDYTDRLSPGQRLRTTRTVAAPTQCTSLNGTNQYWLKTSPNKLTFTDDFVVDAYVKLTSYTTSTIASRRSSTNGWQMFINSSGQVRLSGYNGAIANESYVQSYQSIPLNKWVRVTAQLDMSAFTATPTTSYIMIDGVDVPAAVARAGTNPTALVQGGDLEIGSREGGGSPFSGKIAQVAIYNAKVTQANIRLTHSQGLTGSETSLASAYSFDGVATDLNTTTPNDLTAQASAGYAADSPFGTQADGTISTTLDFGIIQSRTFSTNTTVVVQVPEGCTIPTSGGVSAVSYSGLDSPYGFPTSKNKWAIEYKYKTQIGQVVTSASAWLNHSGLSFTLPIGSFENISDFFSQAIAASAGYVGSKWTISTANNTQSIDFLTGYSSVSSTASVEQDSQIYFTGILDNSAMTTFYLNTQPNLVSGTTTNYIQGNIKPVRFIFFNAYL